MSYLYKDAIKILHNLVNAASTDTGRAMLNQVHIRDGVAYACDGHILVCTKHEDFKDIRVSIHRDIVLKIKNAFNVEITEAPEPATIAISENDRREYPLYYLRDGVAEFKISGFAFHNLDQILPNPTDENPEVVLSDDKPKTIPNVIGVNGELIHKMQKAMGVKKGGGLKLVIKDKSSPIDCYYSGERRGVLMPLRV